MIRPISCSSIANKKINNTAFCSREVIVTKNLSIVEAMLKSPMHIPFKYEGKVNRNLKSKPRCYFEPLPTDIGRELHRVFVADGSQGAALWFTALENTGMHLATYRAEREKMVERLAVGALETVIETIEDLNRIPILAEKGIVI